METACISGSDPIEIVAAHELRTWSESAVDTTQFQCLHCSATLAPASFRPHNVVQPYFRTPPDVEHEVTCLLIKEIPAPTTAQRLRDLASQIRSRTSHSKYPIKLLEPTEPRVAKSTEGVQTLVQRTQDSPSASSSSKHVYSGRASTSRSLRAFADAHWSMVTEQRLEAPIDLPGIDSENYQYAFRRLKAIQPLNHSRVFYAPIRFTAELQETTTHFKIELFAGDFDADSRQLTSSWNISVDHTAWAERQRADFRAEFNLAIRAARENRGSTTPRCYALARQDPRHQEVLHVDKRHLITIITHPSK